MFIGIVTGGKYKYVKLLEGYRDENGKTRNRVVKTFGRLDVLLKEDPEAVNKLKAKYNGQHKEKLELQQKQRLKDLEETMDFLDMPFSMAERYLNEGFSGGEKKRNEILQLMMIKPKFAILDEIDSGLDIDALKVVSKGVNEMRSPDFGSLIITHYQRLLNYIVPDVVHVMMDGRIVTTGGPDLAKRLEAEGYAGLRDELGLDIKLAEDKA